VSKEPSSHATHGSTLADFTSLPLVLPHLEARDREGALWELSEAFGRLSCGPWNAERIYDAALDCERKISTAMEFGIAFPHVRSTACPRLQFALGRFRRPITWGKYGSLSVRFIFLNAVPSHDGRGYLKLVSSIARLHQHPDLLDQLKTAKDAAEMFSVLGRLPVRK
jgi:PTS system nitrogen regulatory IIA component